MLRRPALLLLLALFACASPTALEPLPRHVVFLGDSITSEMGTLAAWYGADAAEWTNAGVPGDSAAGMLARLERDVPATATIAVVLVGINDVWGGYEPDSIAATITLIADALRARGVTPLVGTLLPVTADYPHAAEFNAKIARLNALLRELPVVVDYYPAFVQPDSTGNPALLRDGLHPNTDGQRLLVVATAAALRAAH